MATPASFEVTPASNPMGHRIGRLTTPHGVIDTPAFVPAAWEGVVPALDPEEIAELGGSALAVSAFQLARRPGVEVAGSVGGLRAFMRWPGPLLSDGGTRDLWDMSLLPVRGDRAQGRLIRVDGEGATFASPVDGSRHQVTPEQSLADQEALAADLITALAAPAVSARSRRRHGDATEITTEWVRRFLDARTRPDQAALGAIPLNESAARAARALAPLPLDGFVLYDGGDENVSLLGEVLPDLPPAKLRVLVTRVGGADSRERSRVLRSRDQLRAQPGPQTLVDAANQGIDLVVSDEPVRAARRGIVYSWAGLLDLSDPSLHSTSTNSFGPINAHCQCPTCRDFTLAYLSHLFQAGELLGNRLATLHNLAFTLNLFGQFRIQASI